MESLNMKRQKKLKTKKCRNKLRKNSRTLSEEAGTSKHYESETRHESHSTKENGKNCVTTSRLRLKVFPKAIRSSTVTRAPCERDESASLPASTATDSDNELQNNENGLGENTLPFGFSSWSAYNDWLIQYQNCQQLVDAISLHVRETYPELLEEAYEIKPLDNTFRQKRLKVPSPPSAKSGTPLAGTSLNTSNPSSPLFTEDYPCPSPPLRTSMPGILDTPEYNYYPHKLN